MSEHGRSAMGPVALVLVLSCGTGCRGSEQRGQSRDVPAPVPSSESSRTFEAEEGRSPDDHVDLVSALPTCEIEHQGRLLDFGTDALRPWSGFRVLDAAAHENVTRDAATYLEAASRELSYDFWLDEPLESLELTLRGKAGAARRLGVVFDGKRAPAVRLPDGEARVVALPKIQGPFAAGLHRLTLQLGGAPRGSKHVLAELDWLRVRAPDARDAELGYAPPTLDDVIEDVALAGTPRRSLVLRAPSTARCFVRPLPDTRLRVALGFWGNGSGIAEIIARREGTSPVTLERRKVSGGDSAVWTPIELDLGRFAPEPVALEFRARDASRGGRLTFGDPELVRKAAPAPEPPAARVVLLVVLSGVDRRRLPPWGSGAGLVALSELARTGAAFSRYRAPTTVPAGVLATMLTGLAPRVHGLEAPLLRLPATLRAIPRLTKEASGSAAMYTSVPTSFAPFGFDAGWDVFEAFSPVKDLAASEPFTRAAAWLERVLEERPRSHAFVVIHARGAHPPWDISREEAQQLKPHEYGGAIDPRRAGIVLGGLRTRGARGVKRIVDDDWTRIRVLGDAALAKQDAGLAKLFAVLKERNAWDNALVIVAGDVGPGEPPDLPYDPAGPLTEDRLAVPLLVGFPGHAFAGREIQASVTATDIARTLYAALDLRAPDALGGVNLFLRAGGRGALDGDVQHATLFGRYSTRLGSWLLHGELGRTPKLCALDIDPACAVDVFAERSIAARATWLGALAAESARVPAELGSAERTPAELDAETRAALTVWGDIPE
ncbi:MAG TPA: sulfatase-like hydrolase/transferase [Polyangiaceae bacterium]